MMKSGVLGVYHYVKAMAQLQPTITGGVSAIASLTSTLLSPLVTMEEFSDASSMDYQLIYGLFSDKKHWMVRLYGVKAYRTSMDSMIMLGYTLHYIGGTFIMAIGWTDPHVKPHQVGHVRTRVMYPKWVDIRKALAAIDLPASPTARGLRMDWVNDTNRCFQHYLEPHPSEATFIEPEVRQRLKSILDAFTNKEEAEERKRLGQPLRLAILLHGPPGTGKTRLVSHLSVEYYARLCVYPVGKALLPAIGHRTESVMDMPDFLLLDEMEKAFASNTTNATEALEESTKIATLSSFLDGTDSPSNAVIFLIANDITAIPSSLQRSRRIHYTIRIDEFSSTLLAESANYWSKGKMGVSAEELAPFHKKLTGAEVIQILDDLRREKRLTKDAYIDALGVRVAEMPAK